MSINGYLDNYGFYMVLAGKFNDKINKYVGISLQYIGQTYDQSIRERAQQQHKAYKGINDFINEHEGYEVLVRPGIITSISQERISAALVDDIEACLIFTNQPEQNTVNKENYTGRDIIITYEGGYYPLEEISIG
jgi:hypothetical protein